MYRSLRRVVSAAAFGCLLLPAVPVSAQTPAAPPQTFWNWMGVPRNPLAGCINRGGNFPECERKPALKAIADPQNLASDNPAIKKAAEIKAQEDLAAQKIKAIKYLAEIGCGGCYPGVDKALAAALEDCTEAVRYEAVKAVLAASACGQDQCVKKCVRKTKTCKEAMCDCWVGCMKRTCATMHLLCGKPGPDGVTLKSKCPGYGCGAGGQCQPGRCACGDGNCCTSEILNKLSTMAFEKDDRGCWKEPSPRVRAMARQALRACGPNIRPYTDAPVPMPEEVPVAPGKESDKETTGPGDKETAAVSGNDPEGSADASTEPPADVVAVDEFGTPRDGNPADASSERIRADRVAGAQSAEATIAPTTVPADALSDESTSPGTAFVSSADQDTVPPDPVADEASPVAPSPEDLFATPSASTPQPTRPTPTKPSRHRVARKGSVIPTGGFFSGGWTAR